MKLKPARRWVYRTSVILAGVFSVALVTSLFLLVIITPRLMIGPGTLYITQVQMDVKWPWVEPVAFPRSLSPRYLLGFRWPWIYPGPGPVLSPGYTVMIPLLYPTLFLWWLAWRIRPRRITPGHCQCGYDLRGNVSGVCPECGTAVTSTPGF